MAIRKNRRMQKGGAWMWPLSLIFKNDDTSVKPQDNAANESPTDNAANESRTDDAANQQRTDSNEANINQRPLPQSGMPKNTATSMGGKFRGGKSNRRSKSKKSRRTKRRQ